jgi:hypothetical protein
VGRLISPRLNDYSVCTAALVGKHHILTASQCAFWANYADDSPPSPMFFEAGYNLGTNYPTARVKYSYWLRKVNSDSIFDDEGADWLVGILDLDMENSNGIFGLQLYNPQWSGLDMWNMSGYPSDIDSEAKQPMFQGSMSVFNTRNAEIGEIYSVEGYSKTGDAGAPVFGMFENLPRIIGVNSGAASGSPFEMLVHGGPPMFGLIDKAITENP